MASMLNIHQVARLIGRHPRTVKGYVAKGTFPRPVTTTTQRGVIKGWNLWNREDVEAWKENRADGQDAA